jgi:hypothetical protein
MGLSTTSLVIGLAAVARRALTSRAGRFRVPGSAESAATMLKTQGSKPEQINAIPRALREAMYRIYVLPNYKEAWVSLIQACITLHGASPPIAPAEEELRKVKQTALLVWGDSDPLRCSFLLIIPTLTQHRPRRFLHPTRNGSRPKPGRDTHPLHQQARPCHVGRPGCLSGI